MIYTIGFTQSTAQHFFERLRVNEIEQLLDIRLNNRSQLAGFAKAPDLAWFLKELCGIEYLYDDNFAPTGGILDDYRKKRIDWLEYVDAFGQLMRERKIEEYIRTRYQSSRGKQICLLCSEPEPEKCHRRLVAEYFAAAFNESVRHI